MRRTNLFTLFGAFCLVGLLALVGCNQPTNTPTDQVTDQGMLTPTTTDQDAATQGSQVNVWVLNAPGRGGLPDPTPLALNAEDGLSQLLHKVTEADGSAIEGVEAGYAQAGINISINTGSTTPSLAGTTTATASAAQTPSQYPTVSPTQDVRPEITGSVPIGVALPGGLVDQQATATGRGSTDTEKQSEQDMRWAKLDATADKLDTVLALLESMGITQSTATTQPVTDGTGD